MEDKLFLNNKLFGGIKGIIGRRDYFLNIIYIASIFIIFSIPYSIKLMEQINTSGLSGWKSAFINCSLFAQIWLIIGVIITLILTISNIFRRFNDIQASDRIIAPIIISVLHIINTIGIIYPFKGIFVIVLVNLIISCVLLFKRGKVTSNYPYDFTKEFNWGAFLGTWIWGLMNKSYIPLLWFIIMFTPWSGYFSIYCGLKGNEWAYKNKKWNNVEEFNKNQEKQATIFAIILGIIVPILYFAFIALIIIGIFAVLSSEPKGEKINSQTKSDRIEQRLENMTTNMFNMTFVSCSITEDKNKFIIKENIWDDLDYEEKIKTLDFAAEYAAKEKSKTKKPGEYFSKTKELPKTKIYDSKTGKLLAEFKGNLNKDMGFVETMKEIAKAYKFYQP